MCEIDILSALVGISLGAFITYVVWFMYDDIKRFRQRKRDDTERELRNIIREEILLEEVKEQ